MNYKLLNHGLIINNSSQSLTLSIMMLTKSKLLVDKLNHKGVLSLFRINT